MQHVSPQELKQRLDAGENFTLLDIREPEEVAICKLSDAVHIPMFSVPLRLEEIKQLQPVVVYCHHGVRSLQVCDFLEQQGLETVYNLAGGIDAWANIIDPKMERY